MNDASTDQPAVPRAWWVNHNATFRHEVGGGYLWSPQREKLARSKAYDNMLRIRPGDLIISYASQQNRHVGRATDIACAAPKPSEFGTAGSNWNRIGWYVPIHWTELSQPVRHREFWEEIEPLLPSYSPLVRKTRRGNQKVYLAEVPISVFELIASKATLDLLAFLAVHSPERQSDPVREAFEQTVEQTIASDVTLDETTRSRLIAARRGQGKFRDALLERDPRCRVTGLSNQLLLVASHIKPWGVCDTGNERLTADNGLLLAPHIDRLFDRGLISFKDSGDIVLSPHLSGPDLDALGCAHLKNKNVGSFNAEQCVFVRHHRDHVFLADPDKRP
ncbi:HNH endonuclease [Brevundimonas sp. TWP2-3-4b2]|uniref:HNH endonuclease n=1 Tax=Brevundimonas sp. TWP2-3-4b2 TaxID=2804595 RepID=UPI003CEB8304